ncbi:MAG: hypothetical protein LBS20_20370 [Prevotella sp.]|jgi:hypothetical protein|nr:hypothetical protein [Prevotella sp.]
MEEEIRRMLQNIQIRKMMVKNALESYRKMSGIYGKDYDKEKNALLDELIALEKLEKELRKRL